MARVHVNLVHSEDSADLAQDDSSCRFHSVCTKDSIDVVRVDAIFFDHRGRLRARETPQAGDVRSIRRELMPKNQLTGPSSGSSSGTYGVDSTAVRCILLRLETVCNAGDLTDDRLDTGSLHDPYEE